MLYFCFVSEDLRHTAPSVWAHLLPILKSLQERGIETCHVFTDGATGQYKNRSNFFLLCYFAGILGFKSVTWNFWESGHGKGPSDGVGATCKSKADSMVAKGMDITSAETFIRAIENVGVQVFPVMSAEVSSIV